MADQHYTATVEVTRTDPGKPADTDRYGTVRTPATDREVTEVTRFVARAATVEALRAKLTKFVDLIEEV